MAPEELERATRALEHYAAYLKATQRSDTAFNELAERLKSVKR